MEKYFKKCEKPVNEMFVVENVNEFPVKTVKRTGFPKITNISVDDYWNSLSTYDVAMELCDRFQELYGEYDIGLCSYLAQCVVNPMHEAKIETRVNVCDMTMIFGYDFVLYNGKIVSSEKVWEVFNPYVTIIEWKETEFGVEVSVELNVK